MMTKLGRGGAQGHHARHAEINIKETLKGAVRELGIKRVKK